MLKKIMQKAKKVFSIVKTTLSKKKGVLLYVGLHRGTSFLSIFRKYEVCYAFEANPELYAECKKKFSKYPRVKIFNVAVANYDGEIEFNISSNEGASSSIGNFSENFSSDLKMIKKIKVPCVNLYHFLQQHKIDLIEDYISDIQGFDLEALKTLKPYIDKKKIKNITCEVIKNINKSTYNLPDNSEKGFNLLLNDNYECVAKGYGVLKDGEFNDVPEEWWEMDCKWKAKA